MIVESDPARLSVDELNALYRERELSPVEMLAIVFGRIRDVEPVLNAFCLTDHDKAMEMARASEARWHRGAPLSAVDGVPVSVKDLSFTIGWPTRRGSSAIAEEGPWTEDAPCVARVRAAGGVLFGKTTVPEMGAKGVTQSSLCGITRNPWDPNRTPGGSSGGAAAAVASGMGTIALASDAAGSIRNPAALTGVFGHKPTFGLVPDYPPSHLGSLAVIGPITRTVRDSAHTYDVITRPDRRDPLSFPVPPANYADAVEKGVGGCRVAYSPTLGYATVDSEIASSVERAAAAFVELGADVQTINLSFENPRHIMKVLVAAGLAHGVELYGLDRVGPDRIDPTLLDLVAFGRRITATEYLQAQQKRRDLAIAFENILADFDLLITPTLPATAFDAALEAPPPPLFDAGDDWKPFSAVFNLTGQPAAAVPCGLSDNGMPISMQIVGPRFADERVLRAARAFERLHPFPRPDLGTISNHAAAATRPQEPPATKAR